MSDWRRHGNACPSQGSAARGIVTQLTPGTWGLRTWTHVRRGHWEVKERRGKAKWLGARRGKTDTQTTPWKGYQFGAVSEREGSVKVSHEVVINCKDWWDHPVWVSRAREVERMNKEARKEIGKIINSRGDQRVVKRACLNTIIIGLCTHFSKR